MGNPDKMEIDHKDRDGLNNKRENLRVVTRAENAQNHVQAGREGMRGVKKNKQVPDTGRCWIARCIKDGKEYFGGSFYTKEEAAEAASILRRKVYAFSLD